MASNAHARRLRPVTIVVPCYNEARRLPASAFDTFAARHPEIDFLFVNDGSSDDSLTVLNELRDRAPDRFAVVDLKSNCGKAEAVRRRGLTALKGQSGGRDLRCAVPHDGYSTSRSSHAGWTSWMRGSAQGAGAPLIEYPLMRWEHVGGSKLRATDLLIAAIDLARIAGRYRLHLGSSS